MLLFLQISQYFGFILTEITNIFLLWLIVKKSSSRFGSYKYIMMSYAIFSIGYAVIEILTRPVMHLHGSCMFIYADSFFKFHKTIAMIFVGLYCATFATCVNLLATHFVYRFVAICRPQDIHHFKGLKLLRIYLIPVLSSVAWFYSVAILMGPSDKKSEYMRDAINETYSEDTFKIGYIAAVYYYIDPSGTVTINWSDLIGAFICCGIMQSCILTMVLCGWKTYKKMQSVGSSMSKRTKELNSQLFKTLIIQTIIPVLTMFTPVGLLLILPMFSIGVGKFANAPGFYAGFYPALDALIAIFMIRDFRDTVLCKGSRVSQASSNRYSSKNGTQ